MLPACCAAALHNGQSLVFEAVGSSRGVPVKILTIRLVCSTVDPGGVEPRV